MEVSDQAKRLIIVYNDYLKNNKDGGQISFSKVLGISQATFSRMVAGKQTINRKVTSIICMKLGYSASWFINGLGNKNETELPKTLTEVQMLRSEIDILRNEMKALKARMKYYEEKLGDQGEKTGVKHLTK